MYSSTLLVVYLIVMGSVTLNQGLRSGTATGKMKLVIYDPKSEKQTAAVDIGPTSAPGNDGMSLFKLPIYWVPCTCEQMKCTCCIGIRLQNRNFDKRVCIQAGLLLPAMRLQIVINVGNRMVLGMSVPLLEMQPLCVPTFLPIPVFICLQISDIVLPIGRDFEGCLSLLLRFMTKKMFELRLGCIRLGPGGVGIFRPWLLEELVSSEDERQDIQRGDSAGISLEGMSV